MKKEFKRRKKSPVPKALRDHIEIVLSVPPKEDAFTIDGINVILFLRETIKRDRGMDKGLKKILNSLITWLLFPRMIDSYYVNDMARREFKAQFLTNPEYEKFKKFLDRNKLKTTHILYMSAIFDAYGDEIFLKNKNLERRWDKLYKIVKISKKEVPSEYQTYELGERLSYINKLEELIVDICFNYAINKIPQ
jgi:hypothetical protein